MIWPIFLESPYKCCSRNRSRPAIRADTYYMTQEEPLLVDELPNCDMCDRAALTAMSTSPTSIALSKDLKKRGWSFIGPTTAHAFMQAVGMVNDHVKGCAVHAKVEAARTSFKRPRKTTQ